MKILVTGATGSLGSRLISRWQGQHELTASGRKNLSFPRSVKFARGDLTDADFTDRAVRGQEAVVHCAALASAWGPWEDFERANVLATRNVVEACLRHGVQRLVHISTPSIYFAPRDRLLIKESDPIPEPATHYARSKLLAEEIVRAAKAKSGAGGMQTVMLRPRGIFGPTDQVILPKILRLLRKGWFPLVRGGKALVDLTHVDNVALAIERGLDARPAADGEAFNISNGEPIAVRELVQLIAGSMRLPVRYLPLPLSLSQGLAGGLELAWKAAGAGGEPPLTKYGLGLLSFDQTLDLSKARALLGYAPEVKLREGILSTLAAMEKSP